jgi:hypothetical protein
VGTVEGQKLPLRSYFFWVILPFWPFMTPRATCVFWSSSLEYSSVGKVAGYRLDNHSLIQYFFFWTKSIVQYTEMKPQHFRGWLCPHLQVIKPTLSSPVEEDNLNLWTSPSSGLNRVSFITWRLGQSQPLKCRGFILVYWMMDLVQENNDI